MGVWPYWESDDDREVYCKVCRDAPPVECWCNKPEGCGILCTGWRCEVCGSEPPPEPEEDDPLGTGDRLGNLFVMIELAAGGAPEPQEDGP